MLEKSPVKASFPPDSRPVALVTGAGRGPGVHLARLLNQLQFRLVLHAFSSELALKALVAEINSSGGQSVGVIADLRKSETPTELITAAQNNFGRLDLLINNAATFPDKNLRRSEHSIFEERVSDWDEAISVNARAPFFLMQQAYPLLSANSSAGCVINMLDESITKPFLSRSAHSASKAALAAMTTLAATSFGEKVRVFGVELPTLDEQIVEQLLDLVARLVQGDFPEKTILPCGKSYQRRPLSRL